ncbi:GNAT family N-acetyltransferase [Winogradskyella poriferorum]
MNYLIETDRLYMRRFLPTDTQDMFEMDSNPKVHKFLGNNPVKTIEESEKMVAGVIQQYSDYDIGRLAMILKSTNEFVGWSGLKYEREVRQEFNYYDVGYRLKESFWGHGYATEAAIASLDYGFNTLNLKEINAAADVEHTVSNKILRNIGMQPDGTFFLEGIKCNWYTAINPEI